MIQEILRARGGRAVGQHVEAGLGIARRRGERRKARRAQVSPARQPGKRRERVEALRLRRRHAQGEVAVKRVRGGYANAWAKKFEGSAPPSPDATGKPPVALAGARALGGPVQNGLSYLVGEKGPEIFTPGASGGISTNATLNRLADVGSRTVPAEDGGTSPSIAPSPASVAKLRPQGGNVSTRGDTSVHNEWHIHGANDPAHVQRQVETHFFDMVRRIESDQRGLLSD